MGDMKNRGIAVIGMASRVPGANSIEEYWNNLIEGKDTIRRFSDEELAAVEFRFEEIRNNPDYVKAKGILEDVDKFDAEFFGMTPRDAARTDPQQRVWLETAWEAFEDAGCDPVNYPGRINVYAGGFSNTYLLNNVLRDTVTKEHYIRQRYSESFQLLMQNDVSYIPTKTAYHFNLKGAALNIQTTCSTSLVAIIEACQNLSDNKSDMCLAGAVCISVPQETGYMYQEGSIYSPEGVVRPFDAAAKGTVFSNGVGAVILKRLEDAERDNDRIYAVVRGWGTNNDGSNKLSYTAPSIEGQSEVIMIAQDSAGISPEEISYIEAHGTGTLLGDPIELSGLKKAFEMKTDKKQFCAIGSVKGNIGHTDVAAGVVSFIKSCLIAYNKLIPRTINFSKPNPHFNFKDSPFYVQTETTGWKGDKPFIMGISSFGIGGTNSHAIIEEYHLPDEAEKEEYFKEWPSLLILSARSEQALKRKKDDLMKYIRMYPELNINDVAYTLEKGRNHMPYRSFTVAEKLQEIISIDDVFTDGRTDNLITDIAFMFPGQGAQYIMMGKDLYESNELFRSVLDECFGILRNETGNDLKTLLFESHDIEEADRKLASTEITQPALFIIEYALAKLFESFNIKPKYLIGHSIGEYTAACIAGVFDLHTALKIVIKRGSLMNAMPHGMMMAVRSSIEALKNLKNNDFEVAANNAPGFCTISLKEENYERVVKLLDENKMEFLSLNTSHAFHSEVFDPILHEFGDYVDRFDLKPPEIHFISCLTGTFITEEQATSGKYWAQQLRNTVHFGKGISTISNHEDVLFLEVGPNTHLSSMVRQNKDVENKKSIITTLGKPNTVNEKYRIVSALGNIHNLGQNVDFSRFYRGTDPHIISLPAYPFKKERHWIDFVPGQESPEKVEYYTMTTSKKSLMLDQPQGESSLISELKAMLFNLTGLPPEKLNEDLSLEENGLESLLLVQLAGNLEKKYKVKIEFRKLAVEYSTLKSLAKYLAEKSPYISNHAIVNNNKKVFSGIDNFVKFQPLGNKEPLIIVHGDNANRYLPEFMGTERPVYGYLHVGSDGEKINFKSVEDMSDAYLAQLLAVKPQGPYYLGGYSFGGVLAYDMAVKLQKMGHEVPFLTLIDTLIPLEKEPVIWQRSFFKIIRKNILGPAKRKLILLSKRYMCRIYILMKNPVPVKLRNFYILDKYHLLSGRYSGAKFNGELLLFKATENRSSIKNLGWEKLTDNINLVTVKGDHETIIEEKESCRIIHNEIAKYLN